MAFVGLQVKRLAEGRGLFVHQAPYITSILKKNGLESGNPSKTSGECGEVDSKEVQQEIEKVEADPKLIREAQRMTGELIWLVTRTRPDIAYTVHRAATFTLREPQKCIDICKRLLRYLKGTNDTGIWYKSKAAVNKDRKDIVLTEFSDGVVSFTDMSFSPYGGHPKPAKW